MTTMKALIVIPLFILCRTYHVLLSIYKQRSGKGRRSERKRRFNPAKTIVVFGSGGHTSEMMSLIDALPSQKYSPLIHVIADTDTTSESRVAATKARTPDAIYSIPRSREVGQSYITSIITTCKAMLAALSIVWQTCPDLVLCNGPGTCLPIIYMTFLFRIMGLCVGNVVFVESFCRVQT